MKQIQRFRNVLSSEDGRFLYLDGQISAVNQSVVDIFEQQKKEGIDLDEKKRISEAKRLAMNQVPTLAGEVIDDISRYFNKPSKIGNTTSVEELKTSVSSKVFDVLRGNSGASIPTWGNEYKDLIDNIENDEASAEATLEDTDRAFHAISETETKYQRRSAILIENRNKLNRAEFTFKNFLKGSANLVTNRFEIDRKDSTSEFYRFTEGNKVAIDVFTDIKSKIEQRKNNAKAEIEVRGKDIQSDFYALTTDEKTVFIEAVKDENDGTDKMTGHSWMGVIIDGLSLRQRVEIFKSLDLDPTRKLKAFENTKESFKTLETDLENRNGILKTDLSSLTEINIKAFKGSLKGINPDTSFDPSNKSNFSKFVEEIQEYFNNREDEGSTNVFTDYTNTFGLNDYEKFTVYFKFFVGNLDEYVKDRMPKELRRKFVTYLEYIANVEVLDVVEEGYSEEFMKEKKKVKGCYESAQTAFEKVGEIDVKKDPEDDQFEEANNFISSTLRAKKLYEEQKSKSKELTEDEKKKLDEMYKGLGERIKDLEQVKKDLENERQKYNKAKHELTKKKEDAILEKERAETKLERLKKEEAELEKRRAEFKTDLNDAKNKFAEIEVKLEEDKDDYKIFKNNPDKEWDKDERAKKRKKYFKTKKEFDEKESEVTALKTKYERVDEKLENIKEKIRTQESEVKIKEQEFKNLESSLTNFDKGIVGEITFTNVKDRFGVERNNIDHQITDLDDRYPSKAEALSTDNQMQYHIKSLSAKENNELYKDRVLELQKKNLEILKTLPQGTNLEKLEYVNYFSDKNITSNSALDDPKHSIENMQILEKTKDAVVGLADDKIIVIQMASSGRVEILSFDMPDGYDGTSDLPPEYFPETAQSIGEITTIKP